MVHKKNKKNMVWIDMEMTGLDPAKERIIEIATIITNSELEIVAEGPNLIIHQSKALLARMDTWNKKHHTKSGLLDKVKASKLTTEKAEAETLKFIKKYCYAGKSLLCGNSVHHDRRFIDKYMPKLSKYLHYRHVDVSTIKDLAKRWYGKNKNEPKKQGIHRALDDIKESVEELKFYRETYFKTKENVKK